MTKELPVERLYREGKFFEVTQGSLELQRVVVARDLLRSFNPDAHARWKPGQ
jgi:alkylation response protein AidB-like acyl-CoA dehydrogenase